MLKTIDWIYISAYFVLIISIGLYYRKKVSGNLNDYFLGGRKLSWWLAGLSMVATTFAADTPLVVTELIYKNGIAGNWLWWNFLIGGMLTTFFFARLWRRANVLTELEFISIRYSGKEATALRGIRAVYIALVMNSLIIAWVNLAMMSIIEVFFGINGSMLLLIIFAAMLLSAVYTVASGLKGVAVTDAIQFVIAMTGSILLAIFVIKNSQIQNISNLVSQLPKQTLSFFPTLSDASNLKTLGLSVGAFLAYGFVQWWASWYPGAEPGGGGYIAQRMMSTKNEKHAVASTLFFQIAHYAIRPWPWIIVGLAALIIYPNLDPANARYAYVYAIRDFLPTGLKGLMIVALFAAYMSTISTQLNFGASILTNDFLLLFVKKKHEPKKLVFWGRLVTLLIMFISIGITSQINSISGVWQFMIECGAGLGLVLILRWYWWRINAWSEITAMIAPFFFYAISNYVFKLQFPNSYFITVGATTITWLIVTFLTKPSNIDTLSSFYNKIEPQGFWKPFALVKTTKSNSWLFAAWISSALFIYSALFAIGYTILHQWHQFLWLLPLFAVSGGVLAVSVKKTKILE